MKCFKMLLLIMLSACFIKAEPVISYTDHSEILKDFNIENTKENLNRLTSIYNDISQSDRELFKSIVNEKTHHAYLIKNEIQSVEAPNFLLYLAIVESKLLNNATSNSGAGGVWQFIPDTGRIFGLRIDSQVDERRDIIASTDAAMSYLAYLKTSLGKWYLALMAYNCGEGCMKRAVAKLGSDDFDKLMRSSLVPNETKRHIKKIIKHSYMANSSDIKEIFKFEKEPLKLKRITVEPRTSLKSIADIIGMDTKQFANINAHIKNGASPSNSKYFFYVPEKEYDKLIAINKTHLQKSEIYASLEPKKHKKSNRKKEDKVEVATDDIFDKNSEAKTIFLAQNKLINQRQIYTIDLSKNTTTLNNVLLETENEITQDIELSTQEEEIQKYIIQNGDTLTKISKKFNVKIKDIISLNNIKNDKIKIGETIVIP